MSQPNEPRHRIEYRDAEELVPDISTPLPRAELSRRAQLGLWALRIFAVVMSLLVIYTFIANLS